MTTLPIPVRRRRDWWRLGTEWFSRSLPLRVVASVFCASVVVLVLGGFLLMRQATAGVLEGKEASVRSESRQALDTAQQQFNSADPTGDPDPDKKLAELALSFSNRGGGGEQFDVIIAAGGLTTAREISAESIPAVLRQQVATSSDLLMTPTEVVYLDGRPSVPGLAVGSVLTLPGSPPYQIYFIFPLTQQLNTLSVLQTAVVTTGAVVVILLTFIAALVARQVVIPVRAARRAAESLASGNLDDRLRVRGSDDIARMATSMNYMADELQKQINQLEDLSAVQQRFVSDVSHELRTPLTTVRMAAEVLYEAREEFEDPIAARSAELLQTELDRFEALLTDLLEISRFDAGAAVLSLGPVDLHELADYVVAGHDHLIASTGTPVHVLAEGRFEVEADSRRIERILRNLLVNALEHGEGRPVDILIDGDEVAVAIAVRDHGVGFEASQAKQVFHRFWRADPARARTVGGTGLGLAISMEDANLHRGWLTAWGRPGMGAQFRLTLPRRPGTILQSSPLPMVPRDLVAPAIRVDEGIVTSSEPVLVVPPSPSESGAATGSGVGNGAGTGENTSDEDTLDASTPAASR